MKLTQIQEILSAKVLSSGEDADLEVYCACASDMMSDVLAFPKEHMALLTGLVNPQVMRTADMLDIRLVVFVRGKMPGADVMKMAQEYGIAVLSTASTLYVASGLLFSGGLHNGTKG